MIELVIDLQYLVTYATGDRVLISERNMVDIAALRKQLFGPDFYRNISEGF